MIEPRPTYQGDLRGFVKNFIFNKSLKTFPTQYKKDHKELNGLISESYIKSSHIIIDEPLSHENLTEINMSTVIDSLVDALEKALEMKQKAFGLKMYLEYHEEKRRGEHKCLI